MFLVHYSWADENGTGYAGKLVATQDDVVAERTRIEEEFADVDARTGDVVEVTINVTEIEVGGEFSAEI